MRKLFLLYLLMILSVNICFSQPTKPLEFASYLINKKMEREAIFYLQSIAKNSLTAAQTDSINFTLGQLFFSLKNIDTSLIYFSQVDTTSSFFLQSKFYQSYCLSFNGNSEKAIELLTTITCKNEIDSQFLLYEIAANYLLLKNYNGFNSSVCKFAYNSYIYTQEQKKLLDYYQALKQHKKKSPLIAGLLSAIIPGLGKCYAGKVREGVGTFLPFAGLAALTAESYIKGTSKSAWFWMLGSAFTSFYIGNIWGSAAAANIANKQIERYYDNKILFDMQLPIRNYFR